MKYIPHSLTPPENQNPCNGQLYIYDDEKSIEKRLNKNNNLVKEHVKSISSIMKNYNPYAKNYKSLHQICNMKKLPNYKMYFLRKNKQHKHI